MSLLTLREESGRCGGRERRTNPGMIGLRKAEARLEAARAKERWVRKFMGVVVVEGSARRKSGHFKETGYC
jgi:hypothetical protein